MTGTAGDAVPVTYYARLRPGDTVDQPQYLLRRRHTAPAHVDELLGPDGEWRPTDVLALVETGDLPGELVEVPRVWADTLAEEAREEYVRLLDALEGQMSGRFALRLAGPPEPPEPSEPPELPQPDRDAEPLAPEEREAVVAFLSRAPVAGRGTPDDAAEVVRTDGRWVWPESLAGRVDRDGLAPEPEFLYHIRKRRYVFPPSLAPEVLDRAERLAAAREAGRVREDAPPGQPRPPTREERLRALAAWHREWERRHADTTPARGGDRPEGESDYDLHHADVEASAAAEWEFTRRAREIMGLDPRTGRPMQE